MDGVYEMPLVPAKAGTWRKMKTGCPLPRA